MAHQYPFLRDENNIPSPTDWQIVYAERQIFDTYGDNVSVIKKLKPLRKFGTNLLVGTSRATIMTLPTGITQETLSTDNDITVVSSSSASDTQLLKLIEGHTISGTDLTFSVKTPNSTMLGQSNLTLPVTLGRATRARLSSPAVGTIYFHEGGATTAGVPDDLTTVHMMITPGDIQTQKGSTAISSSDYYIITNITAGVLEKTSAFAQVRVEVKPFTDPVTAWYPASEWLTVSSSGGSRSLIDPNDPYIIVPKNHDVRLTAIADGAGTPITGGISGFLAEVILS